MRLRLGKAQLGALDTYCLDPAGYDPSGAFEVEGNTLVVLDSKRAWHVLVDATNSADADVERAHGEERAWGRADRAALERLSERVLRLGSSRWGGEGVDSGTE